MNIKDSLCYFLSGFLFLASPAFSADRWAGTFAGSTQLTSIASALSWDSDLNIGTKEKLQLRKVPGRKRVQLKYPFSYRFQVIATSNEKLVARMSYVTDSLAVVGVRCDESVTITLRKGRNSNFSARYLRLTTCENGWTAREDRRGTVRKVD